MHARWISWLLACVTVGITGGVLSIRIIDPNQPAPIKPLTADFSHDEKPSISLNVGSSTVFSKTPPRPMAESGKDQPAALLEDLRLLGTMLGNEPSAIIHQRRVGVTRTYKIHDRIGEATLEEIQRGFVRLATPKGSAVLFLDGGIDELKNGAIEGPTVAVRNFTGTLAVQLQPYFNTATSKYEGFLVDAVEIGNTRFRLGLQRGDVIRAINGQSLGTPAQALQVLKKGWQQADIALLIERNGQPTILSLNRTP